MPAIDAFDTHTPSFSSPASRVENVTPDDNVDLQYTTRAINVATAGVVAILTSKGDTADVFVAAGITFPIRASRILATGTTASGIRGLS